MHNTITTILLIIIVISAIGSFISIRPTYEIRTVKQKLWVFTLFTALVVAFGLTFVPDFIKGFINGFSGK
ncbi:hypothetical protein LH61_08535 [Leuconostoc mesenteroides P45]|uniref:hypothetical protein n=1 Tax=Leuconostoc mesenteroides TaxID=1245 RepID=UPI0005087704|nr:hypothetical protein [Leuconostoc mesenteroides]KGB49740.1 hypothetical protein LH61_08535 [Leuconostoc mesenteroides P45]